MVKTGKRRKKGRFSKEHTIQFINIDLHFIVILHPEIIKFYIWQVNDDRSSSESFWEAGILNFGTAINRLSSCGGLLQNPKEKNEFIPQAM